MLQKGSMIKLTFGLAAFLMLLVLAVNNTGQVSAMPDFCDDPGYFDGPWDEQKQADWEECQQSGGSNSGSDDCVIPESGPWPPCATDGNDNGNDGDDCVIPESGPWPPCATDGGNGGDSGGNTGGGDCVIPESGPWPPCATDGGAPTAPSEPVTEAELEASIDAAIVELSTYWQAEFDRMNVRYRDPSIVETYRSDPNSPPNAFYIPALDAIFIDLNLLDEITVEFSLYAAVGVLAHEWGHFIQDQLFLYNQLPGLRQIELQADCMAGSFTTYQLNRGLITQNDVELARQLFFSIGDDQINPGAPYDIPGAHGTGNERMAAFSLGVSTNAQTCINGFREATTFWDVDGQVALLYRVD